jgi:hypothetical protein
VYYRQQQQAQRSAIQQRLHGCRMFWIQRLVPQLPVARSGWQLPWLQPEQGQTAVSKLNLETGGMEACKSTRSVCDIRASLQLVGA